MFTGLIESLGKVTDVRLVETGSRVRIAAPVAADVREGESVSVNGVCLTVVGGGQKDIHVDVGPETSRVSTLGGLQSGTVVNLERAIRADGRFGGHLVLGHVDGMGTVEQLREEAEFWWMTVSYPAALAPYLIHRGSIAVDGISLTVAALNRSEFDVQIVPFTWAHSNLNTLGIGSRVNLECDVLGKYVVRAMELMGAVSQLPAE
jgi:riboflavin synthase